MDPVSLVDLLKNVLDAVADSARGRTANRRADVKQHIITAMRHGHSRSANRTGILLFPPEMLATMVGVGLSELTPALDELEREGRIFYDMVSRGYSVGPTPWSYPSRPTPYGTG